ncbi:hypothetical protein [Bacillus cereus]|uniref:hypothetical protein n=1 Tax=Bacillus cereus TaxID=1396 RepID=UPI00027AB6EF|nr:hypothetical protein [Bacillus cereus]EJS63438.1 hypothetical protein ICY_05275 [Bacillus cereus BAG2X1-3]
MKDITKAQLSVLLIMYKKGYLLICNEGANYKCWLEDKSNKKINYTINRNTGNSLYEKGWITGDVSIQTNQRKFHHNLTDKAIRKLENWYSHSKYKQELDSLLKYAEQKIHNSTK